MSANELNLPVDPLAEPLLNRERAMAAMTSAGVDALIVSRPENVYYLTNHFPQLARMGFDHTAYTILPLDANLKPILILGHFSYYYTASDDNVDRLCDIVLYTAPVEPDFQDSEAQTAALPTAHNRVPLDAKEQNRRKATDAASAEIFATGGQALIKTLRDLGLAAGRIGVDNGSLTTMLSTALPDLSVTNGEQILRRIRLTKSPAEIALMRYAAEANARAGLEAARTARAGATLKEIRKAYQAACLEHDLTMNFMIVDRVSSKTYEADLKDGQTFMIDCVGAYFGYHGDYGRTVFLGDPTREMKITTDAMSQVWDIVREQLKPGVTYADIVDIAQTAARQTQSAGHIICNPHSVGLHHTDEPSASATYFAKENLELMEGMVLSVDLPMIDVGLGGSAHLEDLVLITKHGAELLNDTGNRVIVV